MDSEARHCRLGVCKRMYLCVLRWAQPDDRRSLENSRVRRQAWFSQFFGCRSSRTRLHEGRAREPFTGVPAARLSQPAASDAREGAARGDEAEYRHQERADEFHHGWRSSRLRHCGPQSPDRQARASRQHRETHTQGTAMIPLRDAAGAMLTWLGVAIFGALVFASGALAMDFSKSPDEGENEN